MNSKSKNKPQIIRKVHKYKCYVCNPVGGTPAKKSKCPCCKGTGIYKEGRCEPRHF